MTDVTHIVNLEEGYFKVSLFGPTDLLLGFSQGVIKCK